MRTAAQTPWHMEPVREGYVAILSARNELIGVVEELNGRLIVEAVNNRMEAERIVYGLAADLREGL